ncbi:putative selenate reductase subunit YgfK [Deltaproteobacteria bacterium OttesenSCG-928-K17]|nr:putative selenate reductase subunit YgfK [Deltaproteobacteria bacterium OttesenSCG-928-K17]
MTKSHSDKFYLTSLSTHLKWIFGDLEKGEIYGIPQSLFFQPKAGDPFRLQRYGRNMETPIGVAAGPQTQLVQNIVSAWLTGSRYLELKTIQVLDELEVTKPCIDMADEGYNCEWSQELKLDQSFNEYLNAFVVLYILRDKLGFGGSDPADPGFIFNMSAGYNLEGIQSPSVQRFFDRMGNCEKELAEKIEEAAKIYPRVRELGIPAKISDNLTVSTMHGCPPEEVEKIGSYFINERGFHTTIKLNPTLIGPDTLRFILNEKLGYQTWVPDEAFGHDLKYPDGVKLIGELSRQAEAKGVKFALKLTNTLETQNQRQNLPKNEPMVYMSGRSLHAVSINLAAKLQKEFGGKLDISFSAGADYKNISKIIACGLKPVTVSSDALRPGGYGRMSQYLETLAADMAGCGDIESFIEAKSGGQKGAAAILRNIEAYAKEVLEDPRYKKESYVYKNGVKTKRPLPRFNCAAAPCMETCPASQDIPRYLNYTAKGEYDKAYKTIVATNPFPNVQGAVCDHQCQFKCTRLNYDAPLKIREIKRFIAEKHKGAAGFAAGAKNGRAVAIIGAGPGGLSAAHYLAISGFKVEIFEAKALPGGMAADAIPSFRLSDKALKTDIDNILALGVKLNLNHKVDAAGLEKLRNEFDYVYLAIGAQANTRLNIEGEDAAGVMDQLTFLSRVRQGQDTGLGRKVIVLGAGNSAMDVARAARRLGAEVTIVYRRTRREMPADPDEIREALEEGVKLIELAAPEKVVVKGDRAVGLLAAKMKLGEVDASGRARPVKIEGSEFEIEVDSIIAAIGQDLRLDAWPEKTLTMNPETGATQLAGVFTGGDAGRGASSLIQAIADGRRVAESICAAAGLKADLPQAPEDDRALDAADIRRRQARRGFGPAVAHKEPAARLNFELYTQTYTDEEARQEAARCLQCDQVCNICSTVCPNRANLAVAMGGRKISLPVQSAEIRNGKVVVTTESKKTLDQAFQIFNLADFCNECGNCAAFCPTSGAPYQDKIRLHLSKESYDNGPSGFYFKSAAELLVKKDGREATLKIEADAIKYKDENLTAELDPSTFEAGKVELGGGLTSVSLAPAAEAAAVWAIMKDHHLFKA